MLVVFIKLAEVFSRGSFVLLTTYSLSLSEAGQFGVILTLVGLFAFGFGFERYLDIQRRMVGAPCPEFDRTIVAALQLYAVNYLVLVPVFVLLIRQWTQVENWLLFLTILIVISEQLSNQAYQIAMVEKRYSGFIALVTIRNFLILSAILYRVFLSPETLSLTYTLSVWAGMSLLLVLIMAVHWLRLKQNMPFEEHSSFFRRLGSQYQASYIHFAIGLFTILALQFDRLAVGSLLPLETTGIYFRHIVLVSLVYQLFSIVSYGRLIPQIFAAAKTQAIAHLRKRLRLEYTFIILMIVLILAVCWAANMITDYKLFARFNLQFSFLALMLLGAAIRIRADLNGMIFHAKMKESVVLKLQVVAFCFGSVFLLLLTWQFQLIGTIVASIGAASIYAISSFIELNKLSRDKSQ